MNRRRFIQQFTTLGAALGIARRPMAGEPQEPARNSVSSKGTPVSGGKSALTYIGSFATPTLTDTYVTPNKKAKLNYGKHTKMAYCPLNGDLYFCGGDGQGQHWGGNDSGSMDTVGRYNVGTHTYAEDFLYRGYAGEPVPRGLDYIAFTWAPSLKEFWLGPGYAWDYPSTKYPWLDTAWKHTNYASYNPVTKKFTDRGPKRPGGFAEGFAGSWDTKRNRLVFFTNGAFKSLDPATNDIAAGTAAHPKLTSNRLETGDQWYSEETDELYFVQIATGRVFGYHVGGKKLRLIAETGAAAGNADTVAIVYLTDSKRVLIVYRKSGGGENPWKLVDLATGEVQHLNLYAPSCTFYNTGCYHPPSKTIVLTGGSNDGNMANGAAYHHYTSHL